ncbi:MAG: hypothetical protein AAGE52_42615 [Myxococcota bacterium]
MILSIEHEPLELETEPPGLGGPAALFATSMTLAASMGFAALAASHCDGFDETDCSGADPFALGFAAVAAVATVAMITSVVWWILRGRSRRRWRRHFLPRYDPAPR